MHLSLHDTLGHLLDAGLAVGHVGEHVPRERAELADDEAEGDNLHFQIENGPEGTCRRTRVGMINSQGCDYYNNY